MNKKKKLAREKGKKRKEAKKRREIASLAEDMKIYAPWEPGPPEPKAHIFTAISEDNGTNPRRLQVLWPAIKEYLANQRGILLTENPHAAIDGEQFREKVVRGITRRANKMRGILARTGRSNLPDLGITEMPRLPN